MILARDPCGAVDWLHAARLLKARNNRGSINRNSMSNELPRTFKIVTVWLLLGVAVFLAMQWWMHQQQQTRFQLQGQGENAVIEITRGPDGHYHWPGSINGRELEFLVDTGATGTAISAQLARELKLPSLGQVQSNTAGGVVSGSVVSVNLALQGGVSAQQLRVVALEGLNDRRTEQPLLGMDVLGKLRWQQRDGVLRIELNSSAKNSSR
jgi:aspartyl protease family protein